MPISALASTVSWSFGGQDLRMNLAVEGRGRAPSGRPPGETASRLLPVPAVMFPLVLQLTPSRPGEGSRRRL